MSTRDPHRGLPVARAGAEPGEARAALLLVHGRGATAESILPLGREAVAGGDRHRVAVLAPQAAGHTWYPQSFLAPLAENEPGLSSGLGVLDELVEQLDDHGPGVERVVIAGFSQGACLAAELVARRPRHYGGLAAFTGGLIGPPGTPRRYPGSLGSVPVFLGAGDPDPHVPWKRVEETAEVLERMGAAVTVRRYPDLPHTINRDEVAALGRMVAAVLGNGPPKDGR